MLPLRPRFSTDRRKARRAQIRHLQRHHRNHHDFHGLSEAVSDVLVLSRTKKQLRTFEVRDYDSIRCQ
ncbi:MAG: hypothetical protein EBT59_09625 [Betaproteobacteria bacterium]|nr:hypothetical protein [Betaproteobacteria bacterium]NCX02365.1 hypothetical protein [Betaproteobacteria bacterium]